MRETEPLYLDDLHVGQRFTSGGYLMEETRIKEFAAEFDPQPFHLDDAAAEASVFKGLAASGWRTAAVSMRLFVPGGLPLATGIVRLLSLGHRRCYEPSLSIGRCWLAGTGLQQQPSPMVIGRDR